MRLKAPHSLSCRQRTIPSYVFRFVSLTAILLSTVFAVGSTEARFARATVAGGLFLQEDGWASIQTNDGMLFVWNVRGLYFSLAVKGKEIKPLDDPDHIFFAVDGRVLQ